MTGYVTIVRREVWRRRQLFGLAAALAVLAMLMPLLPGLGGYPAGEVRGVTSAVLALFLGLVTAVVMGSAIAGRDLSEGRFGFDFVRPVAGIAIWAGRLTAAIVVVFGVELVAGLPALASDLAMLMPSIVRDAVPFQRYAPDWWATAVSVLVFCVLPVLTVLVVHGTGVTVRARTRWLAVDAAGVIVIAATAWLSLRPFVYEAQLLPAVAIGAAVTGAVAFGLLVASLAQVTRGRADLGRAHMWSAIGGWTVLALLFGLIGGYAAWMWSIEPWDLEDIRIGTVSRDATWFSMGGEDTARFGLRGVFIVNSDTGHWVRLNDSVRRWHRRIEFLPDGSGALVDLDGADWRVLSVLELEGDRFGEVRELTRLEHRTPDNGWYRLSPLGSTLLISRLGMVLGVDVETGDQLKGFQTTPRGFSSPSAARWNVDRVAFISEDTVRVATWEWRPEFEEKLVTVLDGNLRSGVATRVSDMVVDEFRYLWLASDGQSLEMSTRHDGKLERERYRLPEMSLISDVQEDQQRRSTTTRTVHGWLVSVETPDDETVVTAERDGRRIEKRFDNSEGVRVWIGQELDHGRVLLHRMWYGGTYRRYDPMVLSLDSGELSRIAEGLRTPWIQSPQFFEPKDIGYYVFSTVDDVVVRWNADTGELTTVPGFEREDG